MEKYQFVNAVGAGTFGSVSRAIDKRSGEFVAIKRLKEAYYSWQHCLNLIEVKALCRLNLNPNIVKLKEVIMENNFLYFVFEYMECNLFQLINSRRGLPFPEAEVKKLCCQLFHALAYMHQCGYFHRDVKPENLLVKKDVVKIADLGCAREMNSQPPYTEYVGTRWYQAPEVLFHSRSYSCKVDMWAMGVIMAELFIQRPFFPGNSEADMLYKICSVIGSPTEETWSSGLFLAWTMNYEFPQLGGIDLAALIPSASEEAIDLISSLCSWDPNERPTAMEALQHPFFQGFVYNIPSSLPFKTVVNETTPSLKQQDDAGTRRCQGETSLKSCAVQLNETVTFGGRQIRMYNFIK